MFTGFNLRTDKQYKKYKSVAEKLFDNHQAEVKRQLDQFLLPDGNSLDGTDMQNTWFPGVDVNIFISHSHNDKDVAMGLAGYLYQRFGLVAFIDSCVWGYSDKLLKAIDNEYCKNEEESTYDYNLRNYSTSHVHMMLANALTMMIDKTECIIFLNSPESISTENVMKNKTKSPWIYHEIAMTQLVRRKSRAAHRQEILIEKSQKLAKKFAEDTSLNIYYKLDLSHLHQLNDDDLDQWNAVKWQDTGVKYLDLLYAIKGLPEILTESY